MQIPCRGIFIAQLAGMALASGAAYPEQSPEMEQGLSKLQTTHWAGSKLPTIVSTDVMDERAATRDAAPITATKMKGA